jgi:hypothetical protein
MDNQCSCKVPSAKGMTHRLGQPCIVTDGKALLDRGITDPEVRAGLVATSLQVPSHPATPQDLLQGMDLRAIDPQYLDVTQAEIVQRATDMVLGYEQRITNLGTVIQNLSGSRDKLVTLRAALDTSINEVEALIPAVSDQREATNYRHIAKWLRAAADAAQD